MHVVILCGELGARLREETEFRPKPMVNIGGRPILWHIMKIFSHFGYTDFILALGYKGEMVKNYFCNYEIMNNDVTIELGKPALDGCRTLEERFERIDSRLVAEKLKAEQRKHQIIGSEMKKIIKLPDLPEQLSALLA